MIMMANLQANHHHMITISRKLFHFGESKLLHPIIITTTKKSSFRGGLLKVKCVSDNKSNISSALVQESPPTTDDEDEGMMMMIDETAEMGVRRRSSVVNEGFDDEVEYLVKEYGWKVRKMIEDMIEMRKVAYIQAQAFHVPAPFFDDWFFQLFKAEVLAGLLYRLRNSPPDRYACLVAKPAREEDTTTSTKSIPQIDHEQVVGVVDVTALRDNDVLRHLEGAPEYLYVSGIAVSKNFRRQKVATVLLKACEVIAILWRFEYLVLRAYEDDWGARSLYTNAGYRLVSKDPLWVTWIGRKRRILMVKRCC